MGLAERDRLRPSSGLSPRGEVFPSGGRPDGAACTMAALSMLEGSPVDCGKLYAGPPVEDDVLPSGGRPGGSTLAPVLGCMVLGSPEGYGLGAVGPKKSSGGLPGWP